MGRFEKRKPRPRLTCGAFTDKEHKMRGAVLVLAVMAATLVVASVTEGDRAL